MSALNGPGNSAQRQRPSSSSSWPRRRPALLLRSSSRFSSLQRCCAQQHDKDDTSTTTSSSSSSSSSSGRRALLAASAAAAVSSAWPAAASVTLTLKSAPQLKTFTLKAGYTVTVPNDWALAYDRSDGAETGTQVFFGNFNTFQTLSIFKVPQPAGAASLGPAQLLESVLVEQRDNQSTYAFELLSGPEPTPRVVSDAPAAAAAAAAAAAGAPSSGGGMTYFDSEYVLSICRGLMQEGSGGRRRCVGPRDMDLQVVSRHFYQTVVQPGDGFLYIVRASATSNNWDGVADVAAQAVQSFRLHA